MPKQALDINVTNNLKTSTEGQGQPTIIIDGSLPNVSNTPPAFHGIVPLRDEDLSELAFGDTDTPPIGYLSEEEETQKLAAQAVQRLLPLLTKASCSSVANDLEARNHPQLAKRVRRLKRAKPSVYALIRKMVQNHKLKEQVSKVVEEKPTSIHVHIEGNAKNVVVGNYNNQNIRENNAKGNRYF